MKPHSASGAVTVLSVDDQSPIGIRTQEKFACDDPMTTQVDPTADCGSVDSINLQLDLYYNSMPGSNNSGSISVFEFGKGLDSTDAAHRLLFDANFEPSP